MCFTYRILEPMDSHIHVSMFSPALEKVTSRPDVQFPSVYCLQSTPTETVEFIEASADDDSDDEYFHACLLMEDLEDLSVIDEDWSQDVWTQGDWAQNDIDTYTEKDNPQTDEDDTQTEAIATSEETDHPLAGWHLHRLAQSDWTRHSFIDKTDHIDTWARHSESEYSLARCNWVVFPEDGWQKPEEDSVWGAPELRLITPEGGGFVGWMIPSTMRPCPGNERSRRRGIEC